MELSVETLMIGTRMRRLTSLSIEEIREAIDAEMAMVRDIIASGGFVPFFDHGLPHNVSWPDFVYFVERLQAL